MGKAIEPNIFVDRVSINFKSQLVGRRLKETVRLINNESIPFNFGFNETSFELGSNGEPVVQFSPISGTVAPLSDVPIEIVFNPSAEKVFNFNLICNVRKKPTPVTINVKGEGYEIHETLVSEMNDGAMFEFAPGHEADNHLDFGQVQINERRIKRITIINSGKFNFDFAWKFLSKTRGVISVTPEIGTVYKGDRAICELSYQPTASSMTANVHGYCQILNGRTYPFTVVGQGAQPLLKFSKQHIDFGTRFIHKVGMLPTTIPIKITNEDLREISYDVIFPTSNVFDLSRGPNNLAPGASAELEISFYPRAQMQYSDVIKVEINGLSVVELTLKGEGAHFRVEPMHSEHRSINFGAVRVGHTVSRQIKMINKSEIPATFSLGPPAAIESLLSHSISMSAYADITLRPKGVYTLDLKFQPSIRIPPFSEELYLEAPGMSKPMVIVQGACQGIDIKLENDTLPFGAVVSKSFTTRRLQLQNFGDIGAKFRWEGAKFQPDFSITPTEGYISPGMEIPIEITFHPIEINPDIRYESLVCHVEGTQNLFLTLTGMCIPLPPQTETIKFASPVRQSESKSIPITNKTSLFWRIRPIIENDFWTGPEVIDIEPGQTKSYDLTFVPLEMTADGQRHEGSVFFPLPDGSGILYKLYGNGEKPLSSGTFNREIPCKTAYIELLPVQNWLKRQQRFKVHIEVAKPDSSVIVKGHDFIDVPALLSREYKLSFYAYKEGITNVKVLFKNEQTQEFLFYNIAFKSSPPGVIAAYEMTSTVRQQHSREICITNPLTTPVTFNTTCTHPDITVPHSFTIQPK